MPRLNRTQGVRPLDSRSRRLEPLPPRGGALPVFAGGQPQGGTADHRSEAGGAEQRFQAEKMEAIGQLAGGLAHDFNNLLGVILGYCEMLDEQPELTAMTRGMVREIQNAGASAKNLTQRLLAFSRRQTLQPAVLDLNRTVTRTGTMLGRLIGENIRLESEPGAAYGIIKADPSQIELMLMNLAINARDAMPRGGRIAIKTENAEIGRAGAEGDPSRPVGRYVVLTVQDTGMGMDAEVQAHIFEPFYTTKPAGQGTGLGLTSVFGIVKQAGGFITVSSQPGQGAAFKVHFPECYEAPAEPRQRPSKTLERGTETILLVDDAAPLRALMRGQLEDCGYTVLESGNAAEALRLAQTYSGRLPLMITDLAMPGMSGAALAEKMRAIHPETRVLYASGYSGDHSAALQDHDRPQGFLEKPFTRQDLLRKVRDLLDWPGKMLPHSVA